MLELRSYVGGCWIAGTAAAQTLLNPATEEPLASASSEGVDFKSALDHARCVGGPALRAMSFAERGAALKAVADAIQGERETLLELAIANGGNTRSDAKFDVDGAITTLLAYADISSSLGQGRFLVDGEGIQLGRSARFHGQHVLVPRRGVAVHINAFNFPAWGFAEKAAVALLEQEDRPGLMAPESRIDALRGRRQIMTTVFGSDVDSLNQAQETTLLRGVKEVPQIDYHLVPIELDAFWQRVEQRTQTA